MKTLLLIFLLSFFIVSCSDEEEDAELVQGNVQLTGILSSSSRNFNKVEGRSIVDGTCDAGILTCTPVDLRGRIFSGGAMLGELGPGAFNITMIGANEAIILNPSTGLGGSISFSLVEKTQLSSFYAAPSEDDMPSNPIISRMEFQYDYLDAEIVLTGTANADLLDKSFTIRTVFAESASASDVTGLMIQGDKLIKSSTEDEFFWCNTDNCSTVRGEVESALITETKLVNYVFPGQGNPKYIPFSVPVSNDLTVSYAELTTPDSWWNITFDMTNAIVFSSTPEIMTNRSELLAAFELTYDPDQQSSQQNPGLQSQISVNLMFSATEPESTPLTEQ